MITFKNFNGFDSKLLEPFNGLESNNKNLEDLKYKIEDLYLRDDSYDYSTKGIVWNIFDRQEGSMLEILFN